MSKAAHCHSIQKVLSGDGSLRSGREIIGKSNWRLSASKRSPVTSHKSFKRFCEHDEVIRDVEEVGSSIEGQPCTFGFGSDIKSRLAMAQNSW